MRERTISAIVGTVLISTVVATIAFGPRHKTKAKPPIMFTCTHSQWEAGECEPETVLCYRMADGKTVCQ